MKEMLCWRRETVSLGLESVGRWSRCSAAAVAVASESCS